MNKPIIFLIVCVSLVAFVFSMGMGKTPPPQIAVFFTGEALGELEPCGCGSVKLGGMLQRSGWITHLKKEYKNLFLVDGGFAPIKQNRQNQIKTEVYQKMLQSMNFDYLFSTTTTIKKLTTPTRTWNIAFTTVTTLNPKLKLKNIDVVFVLTKGLGFKIPKISLKSFKVIIPVDAVEPLSPFSPATDTLVLTVGNKARYGGVIALSFDQGKPTWKYRNVSITNKFLPTKNIAHLLTSYQQQVKNEFLLERQIKEISPIGFVSSQMCQTCHIREYKIWQKNKHAHAFDILVKQNYQYDPECVGCHVVGYQYEEGFRSLRQSKHLIHVGCESCHGPAAEHISNPIAKYGKTEGEKICGTCHNHERSPDFDYQKYLKKIKHWK